MENFQIKWDISVVIMQDGNEECMKKMEESLEEGYEPFAVVSAMVMPTQKDKLAQLDPKPILIERVWMRRPVKVAMVESKPEVV